MTLEFRAILGKNIDKENLKTIIIKMEGSPTYLFLKQGKGTEINGHFEITGELKFILKYDPNKGPLEIQFPSYNPSSN